MTSEQINSLIGATEDPHDLCLMCIGLFCATRTSETFGLQWKSYLEDRLIIHSTAYEGELYRGRVKTDASRSAVPIPDDIIPIVEAWRRACPDSSDEALMFPLLVGQNVRNRRCRGGQRTFSNGESTRSQTS